MNALSICQRRSLGFSNRNIKWNINSCRIWRKSFILNIVEYCNEWLQIPITTTEVENFNEMHKLKFKILYKGLEIQLSNPYVKYDFFFIKKQKNIYQTAYAACTCWAIMSLLHFFIFLSFYCTKTLVFVKFVYCWLLLNAKCLTCS